MYSQLSTLPVAMYVHYILYVVYSCRELRRYVHLDTSSQLAHCAIPQSLMFLHVMLHNATTHYMLKGLLISHAYVTALADKPCCQCYY